MAKLPQADAAAGAILATLPLPATTACHAAALLPYYCCRRCRSAMPMPLLMLIFRHADSHATLPPLATICFDLLPLLLLRHAVTMRYASYALLLRERRHDATIATLRRYS